MINDKNKEEESMNTWTRAQLKANGKQVFQRNYWACVAVAFIANLIGGSGGIGSFNFNFSNLSGNDHNSYNWNHAIQNHAIQGHAVHVPVFGTIIMTVAIMVGIMVGIILAIFIGTVLEMGAKRFFILNRTERVGVTAIFDGFKSGHYGNIVLTMFLRNLYIALWTCLFVVPGIIKAYEYMMVPYILAENPGMDNKQIFEISKRMMMGEKMEAFLLELSFIGWYFLAAITCGLVGIFFVQPYAEATITELYSYNKIKAYNEGYIR